MAEDVDPSQGHAHPDPDLVTESDYSPPRGNPFPVVGVGASAGGVEAFAQLLGAIPEAIGLALVLVQHLDPQHESLLPELMSSATRMRVLSVTDGMEIKPDHVYVIPPNSSMELQDGHLRLAAREPGLHLPIDIFFRSLALVQGSRAIGVVLSGNASDGSLGVRAIKAECGITFAQEEATARFSGMPRNAISTGAIDYILPPAEIGRELGRLGRHRFLTAPTPGVAESEILPEGEGEIKRILGAVHAGMKVDFAQYKATTIRRRIGRRMMILRIETAAEYAVYLRQNPSEVTELYKDLLISVTSFFRDPEAFTAFVGHLRPVLEDRQKSQGAVRLWAPGCATGEEVYSLAISVYELLQELQMALPLQIFGTDISESALDRARHGTYGTGIVDEVSEQRLRRFFTRVDDGYQVNKILREACMFARHDVTRDPPFSRLDVVSCRNVLIYLESRAQRRVLPTFHYALNPNGLLLLGSAETTGAADDLFAVADKTHHIYKRKAVPTRLILELTSSAGSEAPHMGDRPEPPAVFDLHKRLDRIIQTKYSPDALLINPEMQILQFRGHTAPYLDTSPGEASLNLLRMAKESLVLPLRRVMQKAATSDVPVVEQGIAFEVEGRPEELAIEVTPILGSSQSERCFFVVFMRAGRPLPSVREPIDRAAAPVDEQVAVLERELAETHEYLRGITEHYEAHAEELQAANEEARSANEELQSTNEELGTTKEELQSANEELTTVNDELQSRNQELATTNSDLRNLLSAVTLAIVMVDQDLRVRRFNGAAEKLLDLTPIDIGRPVGHLRGRIASPRLEEHARLVIETLSAIAEEVQDVNGCWYAVGVRPYRTVDDRIAGVVITFQDIDALKRGIEASEEARHYAEALIETVREPLVVLDGDLRVQRATPAFYETFLVSREETEGRLLYDLGNGQWNRPRLRELLGSALFRSEAFHDFEVDHEFPHIGRRTMRLNGRRIPRRDPQYRTVLLSIEDVTDRLAIAEIRFRRLFETAKDGIVVVDAGSGAVQDVNPNFLSLTGYERQDIVGTQIVALSALLDARPFAEIVAATRRAEIVRRDELGIRKRQGLPAYVDVIANRYMVGTKPVVQLNVRDVTSRRQAAKDFAESQERFRLVVESVRDYAILQLDAEGRIVSWNSGAVRLLGWQEREIIGKSAAIIFTPEDVERGEPERELEKALLEGRAEDERWLIRKDGTRFFASGVLTRVLAEHESLPTFAKVIQDVTGRKQQEARMQRSIDEKSALVREIHHRVKNNLQMIVSLLSLQSHQSQDPQVLAAFQDTESRVRAVANIHEQLYASDDLRDVEIGSYLDALSRELVALHPTVPEGVRLHVEVPKILLPIDKAIPVGLIANELILNSLKHGLREGTGELKLAFGYVEDDGAEPTRARLSVEDSGPGLPVRFDPLRTTSMGYRLVNLLVRQLRGRLEIGKAAGASIAVTFPLDGLAPVEEL